MTVFKIGEQVEATINNSRFPAVVTTLKYIKQVAESTDNLFLGPNLHDYTKIEGFVFIVIPNIYAAHIKEEYCSDPKYIGSWLVIPIHEDNLERKISDLSTRMYKEFFMD